MKTNNKTELCFDIGIIQKTYNLNDCVSLLNNTKIGIDIIVKEFIKKKKK